MLHFSIPFVDLQRFTARGGRWRGVGAIPAAFSVRLLQLLASLGRRVITASRNGKPNKLNNMKRIIIFGLFVGAAFSASAIVAPTYFTYTFEASAGQPVALNGSTITIEDNLGTFSLSDWNLTDTDPVDLTSANSYVWFNNINSADTSGWGQSFEVVPNGQSYGDPYSFYGSDFPGGSLADIHSLGITTLSGTWQYTPVGVPDGGATLGLLGLGLAGLFALRRRFAGSPCA